MFLSDLGHDVVPACLALHAVSPLREEGFVVGEREGHFRALLGSVCLCVCRVTDLSGMERIPSVLQNV